jgi:hypothetical protein
MIFTLELPVFNTGMALDDVDLTSQTNTLPSAVPAARVPPSVDQSTEVIRLPFPSRV